jgi:hypothetical protein
VERDERYYSEQLTYLYTTPAARKTEIGLGRGEGLIALFLAPVQATLLAP